MNENIENLNERREERPSLFGLAVQGILCAVAIALSIIGLVRVQPLVAAIAVIIIGVAFLLEGGAIVMRFFQSVNETKETIWETFELGEGMSAEFLGGTAGIVLGILALLNVVPMVLISVAAIIYGAALVLGTIFTARFNILTIYKTKEDRFSKKVGREAVNAAAAIQIVIGLTGVTLGILAVLSTTPMILNLVAIMVLAFGTLLTGTALSNRLLSILAHK
jgi:hypothetical protein